MENVKELMENVEIPDSLNAAMKASTDCIDAFISAIQDSPHGEGKTREELLDMALNWMIDIFTAAKKDKSLIGFKD